MSAGDGRTFHLEDDDFDMLVDAMVAYGDRAPELVTGIIHESGPTIRDEIDPMIPTSGRTFKGHRSGARGSAWQRYDVGEPLAITVSTTPSRRYLYFPDDGSNTKRHQGNQQFMRRGVENAAPVIMDRALDALLTDFERG